MPLQGLYVHTVSLVSSCNPGRLLSSSNSPIVQIKVLRSMHKPCLPVLEMM